MVEHALMMPRGADGRVMFEDHAHSTWRSFSQPRHVHRFLEAQLVVRGTGLVILGDQRVRMSAGTLFWVPPWLSHWTSDTSASFRRYSMSLRTPAVVRALGRHGAAALLKRRHVDSLVARLETTELDRLTKLLREVMTLGTQDLNVLNTGLGYALARALAAFENAAPRDASTTLHASVTQALTLMRGDGLRLSRREIADRVGTGVTHLSRLFAQELGQTLRDVRNGKRIERAIELVHTGACENLTEAALEAGFGSYSQFHRIYRRQMGGSPAQQLQGRALPPRHKMR